MTQKPTAKDILTLGLVAIMTGLFLGVGVLALALILEWSSPFAWALATIALTGAGAWLWLLRRSIAVIETLLGVDLNRDGVIGEPENPRIIVMDDTDRGRVEGWILDDLPGGEDRFARLAAGVLNGQSLAERYWTGERGIYSLAEFRDLRDYLIMRGLFAWCSELDHRQGFEPKAAGRALLRTYAQLLDDTSPILVGNPRESVVQRGINARTLYARTTGEE